MCAPRRPGGLRAIARGIAAPRTQFTIGDIQRVLVTAADEIDRLNRECRDLARQIPVGKG